MNKGIDFQSDLAAMQNEMESVARIVEASKTKPVSKAVVTELPRPSTPLGAKEEKPAIHRPKRRSPPPPTAVPLAASGARSNVTTRLSPETNQLLTEAALRQKLKRAAPDTRQDIMEEAIVDWLRKHGYGRRKQGSAESVETEIQAVDEGVESHDSLTAETDAASE